MSASTPSHTAEASSAATPAINAASTAEQTSNASTSDAPYTSNIKPALVNSTPRASNASSTNHVTQRPKRATIADSEPDMLEKGQASSTNDDGSYGSSSDPAFSSGTRKRTVDRDQSSIGEGLGGPFAGPPRRATMDSKATMRRSFNELFTPEHRLGKPPGTLASLKNILFGSFLNILLVFIPVSWALHFALDQNVTKNGIAVFVTSFLAIMPLATILSQATEELSLRVGETIGGLINASLGNAVELIVAIVSLFNCELIVTQTSLLGSILSNLLLVLGTCFFVGGLRVKEQVFLEAPAQLNTSLLMMAVISLVIPSAFHAVLGNLDNTVERADILKFSRGVSVLLLLIYIGFLYFSLSSHKEFFQDDNEDEEEQPNMNMTGVIISLVVVTCLIGVTSEWLVTAINSVTSTGAITRTWIGLILLPIASNATEHLAAVIFAWKNKIQMASSIAIGSSIQIALFVIPLLVLIAWMGGKPLTLLFDPFATILLFLTVLIVNFAIADNRSNYLEGFVLIMVYLIVALTVWFVPDDLADTLFSDEYCKTG
ncbi:Sodium/calcium exchanger membrane region [Kalmanozyma brasiliensis GHG001]|uniref:Vacuolar calcium ion transporter n=1 Tax=Kalmanozyma brasiliensis (strain GHG001) TaxID=1365824 RepID=V5GRJ3_KALBG|nr:Sodium/calcium exchanger membrane region [Kalmanozyma brasiliensis GHG001]EST08527.1 Sodium/calcium exchanger membrane region [Kalmanozyma brasiliensis GHG001]